MPHPLQEKLTRLSASIPQKKLAPMDYARPRVRNVVPGDRKYRSACVRCIARALDLKEDTVKRWGDNLDQGPPQYWNYLYHLDTLERIFDVAAEHPQGQLAYLAKLIH